MNIAIILNEKKFDTDKVILQGEFDVPPANDSILNLKIVVSSYANKIIANWKIIDNHYDIEITLPTWEEGMQWI